MTNRLYTGFIVTACLLSTALASAAHATVIGFSPMVDASQSSLVLYLDDSRNTGYRFTPFLFDPATGAAGGTASGIATFGDAEVAASPIYNDTADTFLAGTRIDDAMIFGGGFEAFDSPALIDADNPFSFIGLRFLLGDAVHFGYAELENDIVKRFAYQSEPGTSIRAGQTIEQAFDNGVTPVPEPGTLAMLMFGLALTGGGLWRRRHRRLSTGDGYACA